MGLLDGAYVAFVQWSATASLALVLAWRRLTMGSEYFAAVEYPRPECVDDGWLHRFVNLDKVRLHYVERGPADGKVMLFLHGFPEFWYSWRFQLQHFSDMFRCIAPDLRGYNDSEWPKDVKDYNLTFLIADVVQLIHKLGVKNVILVAHDWGGIIAWRVAMEHPALIEKLVVCNCPHPLGYKDVFMQSSEQRSKSWYMFMFKTPRLPELSMRVNRFEMLEKMFMGQRAGIRNRANFGDQEMLAWKNAFCKPGAFTGPLNYYRELPNAPAIKRKNWVVQPPVLMIFGKDDAFIEQETITESFKYCRDADARFIEKASHWVQQDSPEVVNQLIRAFVEGDQSIPLTEDDFLGKFSEKSKI